MNELKVFSNEVFGAVRILEVNGEPWFVAKDVCTALGHSNPTMALQGLDEDERTKLSLGRQGETNLVNESGMYALVVRSNLPRAKVFRKWVTSEVLPSIRKHGAYMTPTTIEELLTNPDNIIKLAMTLKEERAKSKALEEQIKLNEPKMEYFNNVIHSEELLTVTQIAKDFGMSAVKLNEFLREKGIQFKRNDRWFLRDKYQDKGYTQSDTFEIGKNKTKDSMKWTQLGKAFIYKLLKDNGILITVEKNRLEEK